MNTPSPAYGHYIIDHSADTLPKRDGDQYTDTHYQRPIPVPAGYRLVGHDEPLPLGTMFLSDAAVSARDFSRLNPTSFAGYPPSTPATLRAEMGTFYAAFFAPLDSGAWVPVSEYDDGLAHDDDVVPVWVTDGVRVLLGRVDLLGVSSDEGSSRFDASITHVMPVDVPTPPTPYPGRPDRPTRDFLYWWDGLPEKPTLDRDAAWAVWKAGAAS